MPVPVPPGPGQESVWDYPRPPRLERSTRHVRITAGPPGADGDGPLLLADTRRSWRVLETSHPPVHYVAAEDLDARLLRPAAGRSWCEFKGQARYVDLVDPDGRLLAADAGWTYPDPAPGYEGLVGAVALYPGRVTSCRLDGELVRPQAGGFYGGWITDDVVGPFKGEPGTTGW
ncbi:DUF427 domain-containing protein [Kineococcus glutinatus]|uniref:DUF427 domain-containing protein n=1 Tax=Kineococcus glutinatus TaxID=1070872 RepID=A0ABP8VE42_9ACTN